VNAVIGSSAPDLSLRSQGIHHFERNDFAIALTCFDRHLSMLPGDRELFNYKARALEALGRFDDSLRCLDLGLELEPDNVAELCNRSVMLTRLSRIAEALTNYDRVLTLQPNHVDVLMKRARLLYQLDRCDEALASAERAVDAAPVDLSARSTRGMIFDHMGRRAEALADFEAILAIDPHNCDAMTNRAILYARGGEFAEALSLYDQSLSINPDQLNAFYNRAVIRLVLGDWTRGLREFESRWKIFPHEAARLTRLAPLWLGQCDIKGKTVLLHHEQGYGDTLQFSRYAPLVMRLGARVVMATPAGLRTLMQTLPGSPQIVSEGEAVPAHDFHCPLMSLPLAFGTTPNTVPAQVPYLRADPTLVRAWRERLGHRARPRIGLVWSGRRYPPINYARDMSLEAVSPIFTLDADFISLHTELSEEECSRLAGHSNVVWLGNQLSDFADTAALVMNLDLVITVDTAIAHLAGALGKPVWVMNRYASCWRWLLKRSDSPWYPSLRLFRQSALDDWAGVVADVLHAGQIFVRNASASRRANQTGAIELPTPARPDFLGALQQALDHHNQGQFTEAIAGYQRVLASSPDQAESLHYLGVALAQAGRHADALEPLSRALKILPNNAALHNHYGNALTGLSRYSEAITSYERAMVCDSNFADCHYNCGLALAELARPEAALACYTRAVELNPAYAQAHNARGVVLSELGRTADALDCYERAVEDRPDFIDAWINRAHLLRQLNRYEEALASCERAVTYDPGHAKAHNTRGASLAGLGRHEDALASYERAIELNPSLMEAIWNKGLITLSGGDFQNGWKLYESRWGVKSLKLISRFANTPPWRGVESVNGKVVFLHSEQGYGDTIQFARYCALVAARGAQVLLCVPAALKPIFASLPGVHNLMGQEAVPVFDFHCSLMSLPLALGTELSTIPAPKRYLQAEDAAVARWAYRLGARSKVPRVGLVWSGRSTHSNDLNRSIPLEELLPVTQCRQQWISLQREVRASDELCLKNTPAILRMGEELTDFADAAALIENLDLLITVDTAVAHLAGALGKPVWILLPYVADWRWLREREDSPWYPSARLFRQTVSGDWPSVVERVVGELHRLPMTRSNAPAAKIRGPLGKSRARPREQ
jgi:tetratricopeptide (TPR) repeat protein